VISPFLWFESTRDGTGFTYHRVGTVQWDPKGPVRDVINVSKYRYIDVFRLPYINPARLEFTTPEFRGIIDAVIGLEYPRLDALADTTEWLKALPKLKRRVLTGLSRGKVINPGAFCSQLIVQMFDACKAAGLVPESVMKAEIPAVRISPNDLGDARLSRLKLMSGFVEARRVIIRSEGEDAIGAITFTMDEDFERLGQTMKRHLVDFKRNSKTAAEFQLVVDEKSAQMWRFLAKTLQGGDLRLAFTNDTPLIEDHPTNPHLRRVQEQALAAGLNPGWLRLEGLGSLLQVFEQRCRAEIRSFAEKVTASVRIWNATPPAKLARTIRTRQRWVAQTLKVFRTIKSGIDDMPHDTEQYWRGFPSDAVMSDWISDIGGTFEGMLRRFVEFLNTVIQTFAKVPEEKAADRSQEGDQRTHGRTAGHDRCRGADDRECSHTGDAGDDRTGVPA
jgi:hypothetical protein